VPGYLRQCSKDETTTLSQTVGHESHNDTAAYPSWTETSAALLWKLKISEAWFNSLFLYPWFVDQLCL